MEPFVIPLLLVPQLTNTGCRPVYLNTVYTTKFVCRSAPFYIPFRQTMFVVVYLFDFIFWWCFCMYLFFSRWIIVDTRTMDQHMKVSHSKSKIWGRIFFYYFFFSLHEGRLWKSLPWERVAAKSLCACKMWVEKLRRKKIYTYICIYISIRVLSTQITSLIKKMPELGSPEYWKVVLGMYYHMPVSVAVLHQH